jgi:hypothetical protein
MGKKAPLTKDGKFAPGTLSVISSFIEAVIKELENTGEANITP